MFYLILLFIIIVLYWYGTRTFNYWKVRGVKHEDPLPYLGNNLRQFLKKASIGMMADYTYKQYPNEKVVGFYRATAPELVIRDPAIAKKILLTDFDSFHARGLYPNRFHIEPHLKSLFLDDGDLWRLLRKRITPAFSSGKLKAMFHLIIQRAEKLQLITEEITDKDYYDARELMARYSTDFIGECGFGINVDSLSEENNQFRQLGRRIFERNIKDAICHTIKYIFPDLAKNMHLLDKDLEHDMTKLVTGIIKQRGNKPSGRNDFIDLLLEIREKGTMVGESLVWKNPDGTAKTIEIELDDICLTAQVFMFFGAGFETTSSSAGYTLHQLAFNPDCQVKCQEEIDRVLAKYDNKLSYESVRDMKYLEMAYYEALRMYPSPSYLIRMCVKPQYTFPELNLTIHEGVKTIIPIGAIQMDEKYFRDPKQFDPERFRDGIKEDAKQFVYLPFGEGPRACIGAKLGQMQAVAGLAAVLQKYSVEPVECSKLFPDPDPNGDITEGFIDGLPLKFKKRI